MAGVSWELVARVSAIGRDRSGTAAARSATGSDVVVPLALYLAVRAALPRRRSAGVGDSAPGHSPQLSALLATDRRRLTLVMRMAGTAGCSCWAAVRTSEIASCGLTVCCSVYRPALSGRSPTVPAHAGARVRAVYWVIKPGGGGAGSRGVLADRLLGALPGRRAHVPAFAVISPGRFRSRAPRRCPPACGTGSCSGRHRVALFASILLGRTLHAASRGSSAPCEPPD